MKAFGRVDFDFKGDAKGGTAEEPLEEAYVGLQYVADKTVYAAKAAGGNCARVGARLENLVSR